MIYTKTKRTVALATLVSAAALSLTLKSNPDVPRDNYYEKLGITIPVTKNGSALSWAYYTDVLDNTADTLAARKEDYKTLDLLLTEARTIFKIPLFYTSGYIDSITNPRIDILANTAVTRPMINQEALVSSILDTITTYTEVIDKYFIKASIREESWYNPNISSHAGAIGLMQFTEKAWKRYGEGPYLSNVYNPEKNIQAGIRYYKWMEKEFSRKHPKWDKLTIGEKRDLLAAGYNGGPYLFIGKKSKLNWNMKKMPKESIEHAAKINIAMVQLRQEDLFRNIAFYREKIEKYGSELNNALWLTYNAVS